MKSFDIPTYYRSPIIGKIKEFRKILDPRKQDFSPSILNFGEVEFIIPRHFGFCYGVENAIEISYKAINENPGKNIYLLSQMIHNPGVNQDLLDQGLKFIQDTEGNQLIDWSLITKDDIIIIPAFGTTIEIENKIKNLGIETKLYNTTCPFVEKVWNRSQKLGNEDFTVIIHGKKNHEETRATFSHSNQYAKSVIVKDIKETKFLADFILGKKNKAEFFEIFKDCFSDGFDPDTDFNKIGVVNQTTMLATDTQEISDYLQDIMKLKFGHENIKNHFANTRDTLCYATNDNQSSILGLLDQSVDLAIVIGGYNSSNTSHLVELLEEKYPTLYIKDEHEIDEDFEFTHYNFHNQTLLKSKPFENELPKRIIVSSGASCPDTIVDKVIQKILLKYPSAFSIEKAIEKFEK